MRQPHLLTDNQRSSRPIDHIIVDVESWVLDPRQGWSEHRFRLGWAQYWRRREGECADTVEWHRMESPSAFWTWATGKVRSKRKLALVGHNVGYDFLILEGFTHLPALGWTMSGFVLQPGCTILRWRNGSRSLVVIDSGNWLKASLATWGELAGFPKLAVDPLHATDEELDPYCHRDVELLARLLNWWYRYLDFHECGDFRPTLPGQAFQAFRHKFLSERVYVHDNEDVTALEREGYHGGRTECFRSGEWSDSIFYKLDVNSMYPYCMWAFKVPCSLEGQTARGTTDLLTYQLSRRAVMARVRLDCDTPYFPYQSQEGIIYPTGRFETVLTTPELKLALERGWVKGVGEMAWYRQGLVFRDYVNYWYAQKDRYRQKKLWLHYRVSKGFLNYLYGKFGQRSRIVERLGDCGPREFDVSSLLDHKTGEWSQLYRVAGGVFRETVSGESANSFPAIAAHVTAYARLYLYRLIESIGRDRVLYCDTDSVIVDGEGYRAIAPWLGHRQLGRLKVEKIARFVRINAPKDYQMDGQVTLKGVRRDAVWQGENEIVQTVFPSIRGTLRGGEGAVYRTREAVKRLERVIRSGVRLDDGTISPFLLEEWGEESLPSPLEHDDLPF